MSGQPLNRILTENGSRLHRRARNPPATGWCGSRGARPRPGLLDAGNGPADGIAIELWEAPDELVRQLSTETEPPLQIGFVRLDDGSTVMGFTANASEVRDAPDISSHGGWRAHLATQS